MPAVTGLVAALLAASAGAVLASTGGPARPAVPRLDQVRATEWWLTRLDAQQSWPVTEGAGVLVAVLSTGVSPAAPDLAGSVTTGPDFSRSGRFDGGPYWGFNGTAIASIIAGHGHGPGHNSGIVGIAPSARILSVRVTLEYNDPLNAVTAAVAGLPGAIAAGIRYAADHGAKIIDLPLDPASFGLAGDAAAAGGSAAEQAAVGYAERKGVLLVSPAGDDEAVTQAAYPAAYPGVVAVAAVTRAGQLAAFSSRQRYVTLSAPGVGLTTMTMLPGQAGGYTPGYATISTTSAASAMAAGVAALVAAKYPELTASQLATALRSGASSAGTMAVVNASGALRAAARLAPAGAGRTGATGAPAPGDRGQGKPARAASAHHVTGTVHQARSTAGALAGGLRDAVAVTGGLIALLAGVLLITGMRRRRAAAGQRSRELVLTGGLAPGGRVRGQHEQRRAAGEHAGRAAGEHAGRAAAGHAGRTAAELLRVQVRTGSGAVAGVPAPANWPDAGWPADAGWQGRGIGEIAHSPALPALAPAPKPLRERWRAGSARPPWEPAAEPAAGASTSVSPAQEPLSWSAPQPPAEPAHQPMPQRGHRPMAQPTSWPQPATEHPSWPQPATEHPSWPQPATEHPSWPQPATEHPSWPQPPAEHTSRSQPAAQARSWSAPETPWPAEGPDLSAPFAGRDVLTQSSFSLAAAPVAADYPLPSSAADPPVSEEPVRTAESTMPLPAIPDPATRGEEEPG